MDTNDIMRGINVGLAELNLAISTLELNMAELSHDITEFGKLDVRS